jgi:hypothetical protein
VFSIFFVLVSFNCISPYSFNSEICFGFQLHHILLFFLFPLFRASSFQCWNIFQLPQKFRKINVEIVWYICSSDSPKRLITSLWKNRTSWIHVQPENDSEWVIYQVGPNFLNPGGVGPWLRSKSQASLQSQTDMFCEPITLGVFQNNNIWQYAQDLMSSPVLIL